MDENIDRAAWKLFCDLYGLNRPRRESLFSPTQKIALQALLMVYAVERVGGDMKAVPCPWCGGMGEMEYNADNPVCRCLPCQGVFPVKADTITFWQISRTWLVKQVRLNLGLDAQRAIDFGNNAIQLGCFQDAPIILVKAVTPFLRNSVLYNNVAGGKCPILLTTTRFSKLAENPIGFHVLHLDNLFYFEKGKLQLNGSGLANTVLAKIPHAYCGPFSADFKRYFYPEGGSVDFTNDQAYLFKMLWQAAGEERKTSEIMPRYEEGSETTPPKLFQVRGKGASHELAKKRRAIYDQMVDSPQRGYFRMRMPA